MNRSVARRCAFVLCGVAAALSAASSGAQEIVVSPNLANHLRNVHVGIRSGRVVAWADFSGRTAESSTNSQDRSEKLTIDYSPTPSIDYELTTAGFKVVVEVDNGKTVHIRRLPLSEAKQAQLEFDQPADGKITITLGQDAAKRVLTFDSIWHLLSFDPELVRTDVEPLLRLLRPGWPLASHGHELEAALYRQVDAQRSYDRGAWSALVDQLGGARYIDRIEADRRLRELGSVVVPYLRGLAEKNLDAEQAFRIRMIVRSYGDQTAEDQPDAAAQWLAADPEIWYALAQRAAGPQRAKAKTQLANILGAPVELDTEAAPEEWKAQLAKVREQIDRQRAAH